MLEFFDARREPLAITSLGLTLLMTGLDTSIANTSLPSLAHAYDTSFASAQWIVLSYLLAVTSLTVVAGRLGDLVGRRRVFLTGLALFTVASLLCAVAPSLRWLVTARAVQGACAAGMLALSYALINDIPGASPERNMGRLAAMSAIGTTLGPTVGSIVGHFSAGAIFLVNVPIGAVAFMLALRYIPRRERCTRPAVAFDAVGTLLLALSLFGYALSMTRGVSQPLNALLLITALCVAAAFVAVERRVISPLVPTAMFHNVAFSVSLTASAVVATVVTATLIVGPFYLSQTLGLGRAKAGLILSAGPAAAALTASFAGLLVERLGTSRATMAGLAVMGVGSALLASLPSSFAIVGYVVPLVVMTSGYATFQTANNTAALSKAGVGGRGLAAGLLTLSRNIGQITGASVMGAVFLFATGAPVTSAASPHAIAHGMRVTLTVATALIVAALGLVAVIRFGEQRFHARSTHSPLSNLQRKSPC